jgi:hypothetical protein
MSLTEAHDRGRHRKSPTLKALHIFHSRLRLRFVMNYQETDSPTLYINVSSFIRSFLKYVNYGFRMLLRYNFLVIYVPESTHLICHSVCVVTDKRHQFTCAATSTSEQSATQCRVTCGKSIYRLFISHICFVNLSWESHIRFRQW